jgi:hypothetical protein
MSNPAKSAAVLREAEAYMDRLADQHGPLGDVARDWARQYGKTAEKYEQQTR